MAGQHLVVIHILLHYMCIIQNILVGDKCVHIYILIINLSLKISTCAICKWARLQKTVILLVMVTYMYVLLWLLLWCVMIVGFHLGLCNIELYA